MSKRLFCAKHTFRFVAFPNAFLRFSLRFSSFSFVLFFVSLYAFLFPMRFTSYFITAI